MNPWVNPLLRWAGSKRSLLPELSVRLPRPLKGRYLEPFAGSACLFFAARPKQAVLGDLNGELIDTYRAIRSHPRHVARAMHSWEMDSDSYYEVRALDVEALSSVRRAARFLYLNRLCFNGVYRTNRAGLFNVPFGVRTGALPTEAHIYRCSVALRGVDLRAGDFDETTYDVGEGDFVYLDPPYTQDPKSAYGVYGYGSFSARDLDRVFGVLERIDAAGAGFLFSYAAIDDLSERLPRAWSITSATVPGRVAAATTSRIQRRELLISNVHVPTDPATV